MSVRRFFWLGVLPALLLQGAGAYAYFVLLADTAVASPLYGAVKILLLAWPLVWLALGAPIPRFTLARDRRSQWLGVATGLAIAGVIAVYAALQFTALASFSNAIITKADDLFPLAYYVPVAIVFSLLHSLFEEYFWRWFVFSGLRTKLSVIASAIIGSLGFTLHHIIILSQFFPPGLTALASTGVFVGGLIWCWLYYATKSLTASWISHALADLTIFAIGYCLIFT